MCLRGNVVVDLTTILLLSYKLANNETFDIYNQARLILKSSKSVKDPSQFPLNMFVYINSAFFCFCLTKIKSLHLHSFLMCKNNFMYLFLTNWLSWFLHDANKILSFSLCLFNDLQFMSCVVAFSSLASSTYCFNVLLV